jgi:hypothetical protein
VIHFRQTLLLMRPLTLTNGASVRQSQAAGKFLKFSKPSLNPEGSSCSSKLSGHVCQKSRCFAPLLVLKRRECAARLVCVHEILALAEAQRLFERTPRASLIATACQRHPQMKIVGRAVLIARDDLL